MFSYYFEIRRNITYNLFSSLGKHKSQNCFIVVSCFVIWIWMVYPYLPTESNTGGQGIMDEERHNRLTFSMSCRSIVAKINIFFSLMLI